MADTMTIIARAVDAYCADENRRDRYAAIRKVCNDEGMPALAFVIFQAMCNDRDSMEFFARCIHERKPPIDDNGYLNFG